MRQSMQSRNMTAVDPDLIPGEYHTISTLQGLTSDSEVTFGSDPCLGLHMVRARATHG